MCLHSKVRRHSRTRQEQRRSKKPSQSSSSSSSFSGLVPPAPRNANLPDPISPHRARARDRFFPDEGEKRPPSCFRSRLSLKETRYLPGNGQSSITSTSTRTIGDPHPPALP